MKATVIGKKWTDFEGNEGPVRNMKFYVTFPARNVEGKVVGSVSWNEIRENAPHPRYALGDEIELDRDEKGRLVFPLNLTPVPKR